MPIDSRASASPKGRLAEFSPALREFRAEQNLGPLPFSAPLCLGCGRTLGRCPLTIIATPTEGTQQ